MYREGHVPQRHTDAEEHSVPLGRQLNRDTNMQRDRHREKLSNYHTGYSLNHKDKAP